MLLETGVQLAKEREPLLASVRIEPHLQRDPVMVAILAQRNQEPHAKRDAGSAECENCRQRDHAKILYREA